MIEERRRVLEMLSAGKISIDEAQRLMGAMEESVSPASPGQSVYPVKRRPRPRYLRIIARTPTENVNLRIPLFLLKAGVKLGNLLPRNARGSIRSAFRDKGIDIEPGRGVDLDALIEGLEELEIESESGRSGMTEKVHIYCE
jgi:hypothetical protein